MAAGTRQDAGRRYVPAGGEGGRGLCLEMGVCLFVFGCVFVRWVWSGEWFVHLFVCLELGKRIERQTDAAEGFVGVSASDRYYRIKVHSVTNTPP